MPYLGSGIEIKVANFFLVCTFLKGPEVVEDLDTIISFYGFKKACIYTFIPFFLNKFQAQPKHYIQLG